MMTWTLSALHLSNAQEMRRTWAGRVIINTRNIIPHIPLILIAPTLLRLLRITIP